MTTETLTISLESEVVASIDRLESNRGRFIAQAVANELARRRRLELRRSLENPHPESLEVAHLGLGSWADDSHPEDASLVDPTTGTAVRWSPGAGWIEEVG